MPKPGRRIREKTQQTPPCAPIRRALLAWFRAHARVLPWRGTGDPYAVWVSEVMLQQTQVATVIPFYERFLAAFPTVTHLARAPLERVLELWSGLGYYRRARHMHQAAQEIVRDGGKFPADYAGLRALTGIGDYTAKAVLSIAFNQPYAVLDGNVARVIARLGRREGNLHQAEFRQAVERELDALLARHQPGQFNQALMELGQTVCLPRGPRCPACPVARWCEGFKSGDPEAFPLPRPRRAAERHHLAVAMIRRGAQVAMVRGLAGGLLDDLWNFPAAFGCTPEAAREALRAKLAALMPAPRTRREASSPALAEPCAEFRHTITFRSIRGRVYPVPAAGAFRHPSLHWFDLAPLPRAAISQLARKILAALTSPHGTAVAAPPPD
jgi:A/G-specific adenine glycosylase